MRNFWLDKRREREAIEASMSSGIILADEAIMKGMTNLTPGQAKKYLDSLNRKKKSKRIIIP